MTSEPMCLFDLSTRKIRGCNSAFSSLIGCSTEELSSAIFHPSELFPDSLAEGFNQLLNTMSHQTSIQHVEVKSVLKQWTGDLICTQTFLKLSPTRDSVIMWHAPVLLCDDGYKLNDFVYFASTKTTNFEVTRTQCKSLCCAALDSLNSVAETWFNP